MLMWNLEKASGFNPASSECEAECLKVRADQRT